jgi:uncharacterized membrane protein
MNRVNHFKTGGRPMKNGKLTQLAMTYGERFLIGDSLSWGLMLGSPDDDSKFSCDTVSAGKEKMSFETHARAWIKSIVWRLLGIVILGAISWIITHSWREMSLITILFHSIRVVLYYLHERVWEKIHWGRIKHPLSVLPVRKALTPEDLSLVRSQLKKLGYLD